MFLEAQDRARAVVKLGVHSNLESQGSPRGAQIRGASLVAQMVKNLLAMWETWSFCVHICLKFLVTFPFPIKL